MILPFPSRPPNRFRRGSLTSSVDMFYTVADKINGNAVNHMVTVEVTSGVLSVTELKVCDDPSFAFVPLTLEDVEAILGVEEAPETPEVPEVPETPTEPSKPVEPTEPEKPTEPEVEETKPSKPGKPNKPSKPGNNGNNKPGKPGNNGNNKPSQDKDEAKKVATLKITFVNIFGKKVATATLTKTQTANGTCVFTPKEISAQSPAGRLALWLIPFVMNYGSTSSIVVPVF